MVVSEIRGSTLEMKVLFVLSYLRWKLWNHRVIYTYWSNFHGEARRRLRFKPAWVFSESIGSVLPGLFMVLPPLPVKKIGSLEIRL